MKEVITVELAHVFEDKDQTAANRVHKKLRAMLIEGRGVLTGETDGWCFRIVDVDRRVL